MVMAANDQTGGMEHEIVQCHRWPFPIFWNLTKK